MDIGLYTDEGCVEDYTGNAVTAHEVLYTMVCDGYVQEEQDGEDNDDSTTSGVITNWMCAKNSTDYLTWFQQYVAYEYGGDGAGGDDADGDEATDDDEGVRMEPDEAQGNVWSLSDYIETWNRNFDVFKVGHSRGSFELVTVFLGAY